MTSPCRTTDTSDGLSRDSWGGRRLIIFFVTVALCVLLADILAGVLFGRLTRGGMLPAYREITHALDEGEEETLVMGSSVAQTGIRPDILAARIGGDCHNAAMGFQNMYYHLAILDAVLQRRTPRRVVLGLDRSSLHATDAGANIAVLNPFYGRGYPSIDSLLDAVNPDARWMLRSNLLKYNASTLLKSFSAATPDSLQYGGFIGRPLPPVTLTPSRAEWEGGCSAQVADLLRTFIGRCRRRDVELTVVFPPMNLIDVERSGRRDMRQVAEICALSGVRMIDDHADSLFRSHPEWFSDNMHLNYIGARIYTDRLGRILAGE